MGATCTRPEGGGLEEQVDWIEQVGWRSRCLSPAVKAEQEVEVPHPDLAPQRGFAVPEERLTADEEPSSLQTGGGAPPAPETEWPQPSAVTEQPQSRADLHADEQLAMQEQLEVDELEARRLLMMDHPLEVLQAYAQGCGVSTAGISDKGELASLLLALEWNFQTGGSPPSGAPRPQPSVSTAQPQTRAQQPSVSTAQSQAQAQLLADEQLARRMQASIDPRQLEAWQAEEISFIRQHDTKVAHIWYLVDVQWLWAWKRFVTRGGMLPGPIDNRRLIDLQTGLGRPGLRIIGDYRGVNETVWYFWHSRYGGGPVICRKQLDLYSPPVKEQPRQPQQPRLAADPEDNKCMVCLEQFQAGERLRFLPCLHRYHSACIDKWLQGNLQCPVCRRGLTQGAG